MSRLSLYFLGPPRIECEDQPIRVETRKAIALLAYLAVTREIHPRDTLTNLLWPEYDQSRGYTNLRRTLYALRKPLRGDWLEVSRDTIGLNHDADVWVDVDKFNEYLAECSTHGHSATQVCPTCLDLLSAAVGLYRGDFLSGFSLKDSLNFDEWQFLQAESLRRKFASVLEKLATGHTRQGSFDSAVHYARRWLALDPLNETAHCQLMQLYEWSGQRSAVYRQYKECTQVLEGELGVVPQPTTTDLYQAIVGGHGPRPPIIEAQQPDRPRSVDRFKAAVSTISRESRELIDKGALQSIFVARERELAQLFHYLDEVLAGRGQVVFVIGGAGQGKTALIQEFARSAQKRSPDLLFAGGNCNAYTGLGDPYLPFREILSLVTGDVDALWAAGAVTQEHASRLWDAFPLAVEALVESGPDLIETFIPGLPLARRAAAYVAGGMSAQIAWLPRLEKLVALKAGAQHDPSLQQSALFEQYTRVMVSLAQQKPLLLVLDDLQWADTGSISLLFHLGRRLVGRRILITGAYRTEEVALGRAGERHPLEAVINEFRRMFGDISVDLSQAENRLFVEAYLDSEPNRLGPVFRKTLYRQTEGQPLFTVELLRGMQERGDLVQEEDGKWVEGKSLDWEILPSRIEAVIAERVNRLKSASQEALRVASVEGEVFTAEVVAHVLSADERQIVELLSDQLERRHRLVRAQEIQRLGARRLSRYRFRHILFQNYLYHSLDPIERAYLHEAVGMALEKLYKDETLEIALSLARHFQEAGIVDKSVTYLFQAGEKANRSSASEAAIEHLSRGKALLQELPETPERDRRELDFLIALGVPLVLTKGHAASEVETTYTRALELSALVGDASQRFQTLCGLRRFYLHRGRIGAAYESGEQLLAQAHGLGNEFHQRAHMLHGELLLRMGEFPRAQEHLMKGVRAYDPGQCYSDANLFGNDTLVLCQLFQGVCLWQLGYPDQALQAGLEALSRAQELSHPFTEVCGLYFTAVVHALRREPEELLEKIKRLLSICQDRGYTQYTAWGTILMGHALVLQDRIEEGISQMQEGMTTWEGMGARLLVPKFLIFLATAHRHAGHVEEGLRLLAQASAIMEETGERTYEAELHRCRGELLLLRGDEPAEAERCFQGALQVALNQGARSLELRAAKSLSSLWQKQGKQSQAREVLGGVYGWFSEGFDTQDLKEAKALIERQE